MLHQNLGTGFSRRRSSWLEFRFIRENFQSNLMLLHSIEITRASFLPVAWISMLLYLDPFLFAAIKIEDFLQTFVESLESARETSKQKFYLELSPNRIASQISWNHILYRITRYKNISTFHQGLRQLDFLENEALHFAILQFRLIFRRTIFFALPLPTIFAYSTAFC